MDISSCQSPTPISSDVNKVLLQYVPFTPPDCYTSTETDINPLSKQRTFKQTSNMTDRNTISRATSSSFPLELLANSVEKFDSLSSSHFIAENVPSKSDSMTSPKSFESLRTSDVSDLPPQSKEAFKDAAQQPPSALNMRYRNMLNFPKYSRRRSSAFDNRIKRTGMLLDPLATLAVLRKFLQPYINRDINAVISRYMDEFFSIAFKNIRSNLGESALADGDLRHLQYSIMKNAAAQFRPPSHQSDEQSSLHLDGDPHHLHSESAPPPPTASTVSESRSVRHPPAARKTIPQEPDSGHQAVRGSEEYRRSSALSELLHPGSPNGVSPVPSLDFSLLPPPPPADGGGGGGSSSTVASRKSKRLASQPPPTASTTTTTATGPLLNGGYQNDSFDHHHLNPLSCGSNVGAPSSMSVSSRSPSTTGPPSQLGLHSVAEEAEDDVATSPSPPSSPESGFSMAKPELSTNTTTTTAPLLRAAATKRTHHKCSFQQYNNYSSGAGKRRRGNSERLSHPTDPYALSEEGSDHFEKSASLFSNSRESMGGIDTSRGHSSSNGSTETDVSLPQSASNCVITSEDTFILGSVANAWLGLGAARGRIYTKHPWLFRYPCDITDRVWLAQAGHLPNCGIKAFLMLTRQVRTLGERQKQSDKQGALIGFSLPPWLLKKVIQSANQSAYPSPHEPAHNSSRASSVNKADAGVSSNASASGHQRSSHKPAVLVNHVTVFQAPSPSTSAVAYRSSSSGAGVAGGGGGGVVVEVGPVDEHSVDMEPQLFRLRRTSGASTTTNTWQVVNGGGGAPKYAVRRPVEATDLSQGSSSTSSSTAKAEVPSYFDADGASAPKLSRMAPEVYVGRRGVSISSTSTSSPYSCDLREAGRPAASGIHSSLSPPKLSVMEGIGSAGAGSGGGRPGTTLPCSSSH